MMQEDTYDVLHARHINAVKEMWDHSDVEIKGDQLSQQGIRYCMFQLIIPIAALIPN